MVLDHAESAAGAVADGWAAQGAAGPVLASTTDDLSRASRDLRRRVEEEVRAWQQALTDLVAGQVQIMFATAAIAHRQVKAGKLNALGVHVVPLSTYAHAAPERGGLVIGYGRVHEDALEPAIRLLSRAVHTP